MSDWMPPPFERTTCACDACVECCKKQPGQLAPGDFERIAKHLGETPEQAKAHFWASGGAVVMDTRTRRQFRIGSITPRLVRKRCVFLTDDNRCMVHPVAPFGCGYFDTHMTLPTAMARSNWVAHACQDLDYQRLRSTLPFATSYKPSAY